MPQIKLSVQIANELANIPTKAQFKKWVKAALAKVPPDIRFANSLVTAALVSVRWRRTEKVPFAETFSRVGQQNAVHRRA